MWPRLPAGAARAEAMGFAWAAVSTPFVRREGRRVVGHVGVIELPLVMAGRPVAVGSIHAVCTDPERRGRGLGRALIEEALAACAGRYDTLVLTTAIPDFYVKFGFRPVREHAFTRALPPRSGAARPGGRVLTERPEDLELLRRLLAERAPVSERLGSLEDGTVFVVALLLTWGDFSRVHYHAALDVLTVHEVRDRTLVLYDVVGPAIPPLGCARRRHRRRRRPRRDVLRVPIGWAKGWMAEPLGRRRWRPADDDWFTGLMARGPAGRRGRAVHPAAADPDLSRA